MTLYSNVFQCLFKTGFESNAFKLSFLNLPGQTFLTVSLDCVQKSQTINEVSGLSGVSLVMKWVIPRYRSIVRHSWVI